MYTENYELTLFSNNNFSIIGRILFISTNFEKTFRAYFNIIVCKYLPFFKYNVSEFSKIENVNIFENLSDPTLSTFNKVHEICSKLTFNKILTIFFDKVLNNVFLDDTLKQKFIDAKETRNYIAHELCNCELSRFEEDSFRVFLQNELGVKIKEIIECTLIMENAINEFNKEPLWVNLKEKVNEIYQWVIEIID